MNVKVRNCTFPTSGAAKIPSNLVISSPFIFFVLRADAVNYFCLLYFCGFDYYCVMGNISILKISNKIALNLLKDLFISFFRHEKVQ